MTPTRTDVRHLTYQVRWSHEDQEYVGTCLELPSLSAVSDRPSAALNSILSVVRFVTEDFSEAEWAALGERIGEGQ